MKAVLLHAYGGVEQLHYEDTSMPQLKGGDVLVKVDATSVNPIDWKIRRGDRKDTMTLPMPAILGRDVSGTIVSLGPGAQGFEPGDRVMGLVEHAYAEFLVTRPENLTRTPDDLETEDAAALPLVVTTGAQLIENGVQPKAGQTVLVTGALGSVGRTAVYVAKKHGMTVIAGVRAAQRHEAESLGADRVIALDHDQAIASLGEVDAIADTVGHDVIKKLIPYIRHSGVLASVLGKPTGVDTKDIKVRPVVTKSDAQRLHQLAEAVGAGEFSIPIVRRMKLSQVREAQLAAERGAGGKILLVP